MSSASSEDENNSENSENNNDEMGQDHWQFAILMINHLFTGANFRGNRQQGWDKSKPRWEWVVRYKSANNAPGNIVDTVLMFHKFVVQYLGRLNSISGYTLFDDGEVITLMAIQTNTMVFPGFTLPLVMPSYEEQYIIQNRIGEKNVFVLVCAE